MKHEHLKVLTTALVGWSHGNFARGKHILMVVNGTVTHRRVVTVLVTVMIIVTAHYRLHIVHFAKSIYVKRYKYILVSNTKSLFYIGTYIMYHIIYIIYNKIAIHYITLKLRMK